MMDGFVCCAASLNAKVFSSVLDFCIPHLCHNILSFDAVSLKAGSTAEKKQAFNNRIQITLPLTFLIIKKTADVTVIVIFVNFHCNFFMSCKPYTCISKMWHRGMLGSRAMNFR
jgi:hypothetical protein